MASAAARRVIGHAVQQGAEWMRGGVRESSLEARGPVPRIVGQPRTDARHTSGAEGACAPPFGKARMAALVQVVQQVRMDAVRGQPFSEAIREFAGEAVPDSADEGSGAPGHGRCGGVERG